MIAFIRAVRALWNALGESGRAFVATHDRAQAAKLGAMLAGIVNGVRDVKAEQEREMRERSNWTVTPEGKVRPRR